MKIGGIRRSAYILLFFTASYRLVAAVPRKPVSHYGFNDKASLAKDRGFQQDGFLSSITSRMTATIIQYPEQRQGLTILPFTSIKK